MPKNVKQILNRLTSWWGLADIPHIAAYDMQVGAGTFHPATVLEALDSRPYAAMYLQPCRRPTDGRAGEHPSRLQHYYQFQVVMRPAPEFVYQSYMKSLFHLGIDIRDNDLRLFEDHWESPSLGAWGKGWEVRLNGMEITQFTHFREVAGFKCKPEVVEITYGIERIAMHVLGIDNVYDLPWDDHITYGDMFKRREEEYTEYNRNGMDTEFLLANLTNTKLMCARILDQGLPQAAYDHVVQASHLFNLLDARGSFSHAARTEQIDEIRRLMHRVATHYKGTIAFKCTDP